MKFCYIREPDMADPLRVHRTVAFRLFGFCFGLTLVSAGVEPSPDYDISGSWRRVGPQLYFRRRLHRWG